LRLHSLISGSVLPLTLLTKGIRIQLIQLKCSTF
jgi:hypothetical protein